MSATPGQQAADSQENIMQKFATPAPIAAVLDIHATTAQGDITARSL